MDATRLLKIVRLSAVAGVIILLVYVFGFAAGDHETAARGKGALLQDQGYGASTDDPGTDNGYNPAATDTPDGNSTQVGSTPLPTSTLTSTATLAPDIRMTEDSEIDQSRTTPVATETPGPTITAYVTATRMKTPSRLTPTPIPLKNGKDGLAVNWGMFLFGFSLPILGACGYVLYLLDRRPELFKRFRR